VHLLFLLSIVAIQTGLSGNKINLDRLVWGVNVIQDI